jgi:hypothetical protein
VSHDRPAPPRPDLLRTPSGSFGWLEDRLLHEGWLARLGAEGTSVLTLLALAADRHGASFYGRDKMAARLGLTRADIDHGLERLLALGLVAHRPWRAGLADGVWQLLPVPDEDTPPATPSPPTRARGPMSVGTILAQLGITPPEPCADPARSPRR